MFAWNSGYDRCPNGVSNRDLIASYLLATSDVDNLPSLEFFYFVKTIPQQKHSKSMYLYLISSNVDSSPRRTSSGRFMAQKSEPEIVPHHRSSNRPSQQGGETVDLHTHFVRTGLLSSVCLLATIHSHVCIWLQNGKQLSTMTHLLDLVKINIFAGNYREMLK